MKLFEENEWDAKRETLEHNQRAFFASVYSGGKKTHRLHMSAYYTTRDEAIADAFAARPKTKMVTSGYGWRGTFDIRWHKRDPHDANKFVEC